MLSKNDLEKLSKLNVRDIDNKNLCELKQIKINSANSIEKRMNNFLQQIGNPYCFFVNGTPVQISFANHNKTLDDCLYGYLKIKTTLKIK